MKFFNEATAIMWPTWLQRRIWSSSQKPKPLSIKPIPIKVSPIGTLPLPTKKEYAKEYSSFISRYFSTNIQTYIYPAIFEKYLENGLIGVELRDKKGDIVGTVFSWYCGLLQNTQAGLITWLCVRPDMRKMGIADFLLHSIQTLTYPRTIHFFRNDGWLKSPLPPLWTGTRIYRKRLYRMTTAVQKVSLKIKRQEIHNAWKKEYPEGLILDDPTYTNPLVEVWEYKKTGALLIIQPTFENEPYTNKTWCEVVYWVCEMTYAGTLSIEAIIDALPYDCIEAPSTMPNLGNWSIGGQSSWCVHGLDPGSPVLRPVLSLLAN